MRKNQLAQGCTDQHTEWSVCGEAHKQPLIIYRIHTWIPREMTFGAASHISTPRPSADDLFVTF